MRCPACNHAKSFVEESKETSKNTVIRKNVCGSCEHIFNTAELYSDAVSGDKAGERIAADNLGINIEQYRRFKNAIRKLIIELGE